MNTKTMMVAVVLCAGVAMAQEPTPELTESSVAVHGWRLTVGGFGRGNVKTRLKGSDSGREQVWGTDLDFQYSVWQNDDFNVWLGIGGTFCPGQHAYGKGLGTHRVEHDVSNDGFVTYNFDYRSAESRSVELSYGEFRLMSVPEWKVTENFSLGARIGVAFDWMRAECRSNNAWGWNSEFIIDIPGIPATVDRDSDRGGASYSDSATKFAAQAILGLQATYFFTDNLGIYAACDWRLGGETTFATSCGDNFAVSMNGWCASAGVVVGY